MKKSCSSCRYSKALNDGNACGYRDCLYDTLTSYKNWKPIKKDNRLKEKLKEVAERRTTNVIKPKTNKELLGV